MSGNVGEDQSASRTSPILAPVALVRPPTTCRYLIIPGAAAPFRLAAAQCLEMSLKTFLMKKVGMTERQLKTKIGHDLRKAWTRCVQNGLGLDATMPRWAAYLDAGHDQPYLFPHARTNTGVVLASKAQVLDGLWGVMALVLAATGVT
ncbi:MAG: hypothetical protein WD795_09955 [Woeseia sp.]